MKLKKPIELTESEANTFHNLLKTLMFYPRNNSLMVINAFNIEEVSEKVKIKHWFKKDEEREETKFLLTDADILMYNSDRAYWGRLSEYDVDLLVTMEDLNELRLEFQNKISIPLEKLGITMIKK